MKKQLLFLTIILSLLISNLSAQTVYITKTGKKYHSAGCQYLRKSSISISVADAKAEGYGACSVCNPPSATNSTPAATTKKETQTHSIPTHQSSSSVQCSATTKAGARCKRMTKSSNGKCWQHGGN